MGKIKHLIVRGGLGIGLFLTSGLGIWAQISLNEENKSVREVIKSIEKVSDYRFFYNEDLAGLNTRITVSADDASIETILAMISKQAPIAYTIKNNHQIVLSDGKTGGSNLSGGVNCLLINKIRKYPESYWIIRVPL